MRRGKIARLSAIVREQLCRKMMNGESGNAVLEWLNGLEEVRWEIEHGFEGVPISKQNLHQWRKGGYVEWLKREEACEFLRDMDEAANDFSTATDQKPI